MRDRVREILVEIKPIVKAVHVDDNNEKGKRKVHTHTHAPYMHAATGKLFLFIEEER